MGQTKTHQNPRSPADPTRPKAVLSADQAQNRSQFDFLFTSFTRLVTRLN